MPSTSRCTRCTCPELCTYIIHAEYRARQEMTPTDIIFGRFHMRSGRAEGVAFAE
jgi:hypothetical protein